MATLTIRNLPDEVRDRIRREAAQHGRSMEEEARTFLTQRYAPKVPMEEILKRLDQLNAKYPPRPDAKMLASEMLIADRRIEALFEAELISREEKIAWHDKIDRDEVSLDDVEKFAAEKRR